MENKTIGRAIGAMSLAFGITDMVMGPVFARGTGMSTRRGGAIFRAVGAREVATGVASLIWPTSAAPILARAIFDAGDLGILGIVSARPNPKRGMALLGLAMVAAVALIDIAGARRLRSGSFATLKYS